MAAGTIVWTFNKNGPILRMEADCLSNAAGDIEGDSPYVSGEILRVVTVPDGGGTQPSADWDLELEDAQDIDTLNGQGADRNNAATEQICGGVECVCNAGQNLCCIPYAIQGALSIDAANVGNAKGVTIIIYLRGDILGGL